MNRYRRQRPLRGGSLIVTIFGDAIMARGGAVALGSLIGLGELFGLNERLVRTASARLAHDGWLEARRVGNLSEYALSQRGREEFAEATLRIYGEPAPHWSGRWTLIVLPPATAAARRRLRKELAWHGFGELTSGVFAHPEVRASDLALQLRNVDLPAGALVFEADLAGHAPPAKLIDFGWDLLDLARRYRQFADLFADAAALVPTTAVDPRTGFILRTLLIHDYRRLHLRDPLLPTSLLPVDWPGIKAAALCRDIYTSVFDASENFLSASASRLDGPLPPPDPAVMRRFGGIARP